MWRFFLSPGGICLIIGIFLIIAGLVLRIRECIFCTQEVDAECVSVNYRHLHHKKGRRPIQTPVWRYNWNGRTYFKKDQNGNSLINYRVGEKCTLRINPSNPERFYRKGLSNAVVTLIAGIIWTGIVLFAVNFNNIIDFILRFV